MCIYIYGRIMRDTWKQEPTLAKLRFSNTSSSFVIIYWPINICFIAFDYFKIWRCLNWSNWQTCQYYMFIYWFRPIIQLIIEVKYNCYLPVVGNRHTSFQVLAPSLLCNTDLISATECLTASDWITFSVFDGVFIFRLGTDH